MNRNGLLYVATGQKCLFEAIHNARVSRSSNPGLPIAVISDLDDLALSSGAFDIVCKHRYPVYSYRDKISGLLELPFDVTLFLDSDACIVHPLDMFFDIALTFDISAAQAPVRFPSGWIDHQVPEFFPELNTGVLLFRRSPLQSEFIKTWLSLYDQLYENSGQTWDQASFRSVLWSFLNNSSFQLFQLSPEYNIRTSKPWVLGRGMPAYIVHGRFPESELSSFLQYVNSDIDKFRYWSEWISIYPNSLITPRYDRTFG